MHRYIDAENKEARVEWNKTSYLGTLEEVLEYFPTEDVAPVIHAHWEECSYWFVRCSSCKNIVFGGGDNYCPKCGAKMDEEVKDDV